MLVSTLTRLGTVIHHFGTKTDMGHYTIDVTDTSQISPSWLHFDDHGIWRTTPADVVSEVCKKAAAILLYRREMHS